MKFYLLFTLFLSLSTVSSAQNAEKTENRNVKTIGVLIGSSLIGFDFEKRLNDQFGLRAGFGIVGYEAALLYHFSPEKMSSAMALTWKDSGFGGLRSLGPEYVYKYVFSSESAITLQLGLGAMISVDPKVEKELLQSLKVTKLPKVFLTYGIGFSF